VEILDKPVAPRVINDILRSKIVWTSCEVDWEGTEAVEVDVREEENVDDRGGEDDDTREKNEDNEGVVDVGATSVGVVLF
jgi:hypothetical protein